MKKLFAVVLVAVAGCDATGALNRINPEHEFDTLTMQCPEGEVVISGVCAPSCESNDECESGCCRSTASHGYRCSPDCK